MKHFAHNGRGLHYPRTWLCILVWACAPLQGCDPIYSVGVRANLSNPLEPQCIEDTLRKLEGIEQVTVHKSDPRKVWSLSKGVRTEQYPDQFLFKSREVGGTIVQHQDDDGYTILGAGTSWLGPKPPEDQMERALEFNARVGSQIAQACKARFRTGGEFRCSPDLARCRETILDHAQK